VHCEVAAVAQVTGLMQKAIAGHVGQVSALPLSSR